MNAAHLFKEYRKAINPPYRGRDLLLVALTLLILVSMPIIVIGIPKSRVPEGKAAPYLVPTLYLDPASGSWDQNKPFEVKIFVDSQSRSVGGVQAYLSYPADKLDVVGLDSTGSALPTGLEASFGGGSIKWSRAIAYDPPTPASGNFLFGTIKFQTKVGASTAAVNFVAGSSIIEFSETQPNILVNTIGGSYTTVDNPPTVEIDPPADGAIIKGSSYLAQATATDDLAVTKVEFYVDSEASPRCSITPPAAIQCTLNTTTLTDGPHQIKVKAYDATSYTLHTHNVTVDNTAPTNVTITAPTSGQYVKGNNVKIQTSPTDAGSGIDKVEFYINGTFKTPADTTSPYEYTWVTTTGYPDGSYSLYVKAYDKSGHSTQSPTINVVVDNTAPTSVTISSPTSGAFLKGPVNVTVTFTEVNVQDVKVYRSGTLACTVSLTASPITCSNFLTTPTNPDNTYTITATVTDKAGNTGSTPSPAVSVTYDNASPTVPNLTPTVISAIRINLNWTASSDGASGSGIAGYDIYRNGSKITPTPITATSFIDTCPNITQNTNYAYYVQAIDRAGNTANSTTSNTKTWVAGDFNGDTKVNMQDFVMLAYNWGKDYPACDTNCDNIVNMQDFVALAWDWTGN